MNVAVGFFDGVHLGHQEILRDADVAVTFKNHPLSVLAPEREPRLIMTVADRVSAIGKPVTVLEFTQAMADLNPAGFLKLAKIGPGDRILCGENWRFGKGGEGNAEWLRAHGYDVTVIPYSVYGGSPISSTRIRDCLENGRVEDANAMMGRKFRMRGVVTAGKGKGREIGFPTVNIRPWPLSLRLRLGVYVVEMSGIPGIANFGFAPTMGAARWQEPVLEVHLRDVPSEKGLGGEVAVDFCRFVRDERKFEGIDDLRRQIAADYGILFN